MVRRPCAQSMAQLEAACERGKCEEATSKGPEILNIIIRSEMKQDW